MSNLMDHADRELTKAGYGPNTTDEMDLRIRHSTLDIVELFRSNGHSGYSAAAHAYMINQILQFKNLTPLTTDVHEWQLVEMGDKIPRTHQNVRRGSCFSLDEGRTYYDIEGPRLPKWRRPFIRNVHGFRLQEAVPYEDKVTT